MRNYIPHHSKERSTASGAIPSTFFEALPIDAECGIIIDGTFSFISYSFLLHILPKNTNGRASSTFFVRCQILRVATLSIQKDIPLYLHVSLMSICSRILRVRDIPFLQPALRSRQESETFIYLVSGKTTHTHTHTFKCVNHSNTARRDDLESQAVWCSLLAACRSFYERVDV